MSDYNTFSVCIVLLVESNGPFEIFETAISSKTNYGGRSIYINSNHISMIKKKDQLIQMTHHHRHRQEYKEINKNKSQINKKTKCLFNQFFFYLKKKFLYQHFLLV